MNYGIIAAGEGSRLAAEGVAQPKPLVEIGGRPMIQRLIEIMVEAGDAESVSVIVNEQMPEVRQFLEEHQWPVALNLVVKSTPSSMHSFYELSRVIDADRFVLTTVDTIFRADEFRRYVEAFAADAEADGYMGVTTFVDDEKPLYISTDPEMNITAFTDGPTPSTQFVSGGIYGLGREAVRVLEDCMAQGVSRMRNYQRSLVAAGQVLKAYPFSKIIDVDHPSDIAVAESMINI